MCNLINSAVFDTEKLGESRHDEDFNPFSVVLVVFFRFLVTGNVETKEDCNYF